MKTIYSIGTNNSTPLVLLSVLLQHNVSHLYDIRRNNYSVFSRCRGKILEGLFSRVKKIEYRWVPELAPSKKLLKEAKEYGWKSGQYLDKFGVGGIKREKKIIKKNPPP